MNRTKLVVGAIMPILLLLGSSQANAVEKITGAFGMELGQKFDPSSAIGETTLTDGTPMYKFKPKKRFRSFSDYYVMITPKSNLVSYIWAEGGMNNDPTCKNEQAVLMSILESKYGSQSEQGFSMSVYDIKTISQGSRRILTKCTGLMDSSISIRYIDSDLSAQAEKERLEIEAKKVDSSGL